MKRKKKSKYPSERPNPHLLGSISEMSQDSQPSPDTRTFEGQSNIQTAEFL